MGDQLIIARNAEGCAFRKDVKTQDLKTGAGSGPRSASSRAASTSTSSGSDIDIDIDIDPEHPGGAKPSAPADCAAFRGGRIMTSASTSGYLHEYGNQYVWTDLRNVVGAQFANYAEAWLADDLIARGLIHPTLSRSHPLDQASRAAFDVHRNLHQGKVGVLCLAPGEGLGNRDSVTRERHRDEIMRFRNV